jgi:hypothetical protein
MDGVNVDAIAEADIIVNVDAVKREDTEPTAAGSEPSSYTKPASDTDVARDANGTAPETFFPPPPAVPTQLDACGLRFDFNDGCRVQVPQGPDVWRIRLSDLGTGNILFQTIDLAGLATARRRVWS